MKRFLLIIFSLTMFVSMIFAQRKVQTLGRGVVAVQSGTSVTVTWRRLAQEPEDATWNIYLKKKGATDFTKLNSTPLSNTNYKTTTSTIPVGTEVAVKMVTENGTVEGDLSVPFLFKSQNLRNIYMEIEFKGGPLDNSGFNTKYVWPVDLNGNGEYDYVVDRNSTTADRHYVEAYLADGTYLWTVDLGPNESSSSGQDDQICAYDIDCDGFGEVLIQTSDGTRFWDKSNNTWGLYVNGSTTGDTDNDGIIDYNNQNSRNPPKYFSVIDGMTGAEKASVEQMYDEAYNRTNKSSLMGDEYNKHVGHVGIFYYDGIHPGIVMEWHTRTSSGAHQYRNSAWAFDFDKDGKASNWHQLFMKRTGGATFHQIRILDADGDGRDELSSGAYCMDHDGSTLFNTGISHGDRHRTSDIDPERPGLETFSIQQDAGDMLAQILFDAATGEPIKKWYLPAVGDVGRGECLDLDKSHKGWEMFSTMDGYQVFDAKGDKIEGMIGYFPTEGIWWDGELDRERVDSPDGNGYNADIRDYKNGRLIEMAKESGYTLKSSNAKRGKFWGDIIGDWREELILNREVNGVNTGIVGFTTDYTTTVKNIYCLQEDPHYRGDCTTKGYYQSPNPGFYLGYDMPRPQLPPCMKADAKNEVFDLTLGNATISPKAGMDNVYVMSVKGQTLTIASPITGKTNLWKSQQGTAILKANNTSEGKTIISEGTLQVDGMVSGDLELRARGTLSGSGVVNNITFEGALNYEGGRIMPLGTLTFNNGLKINKNTYIEVDINSNSLVKVNGDLSVTSPVIFTINSVDVQAGEYKLIEYSGAFSGKESNLSIRGLKGLSYSILNHDNAIYLKINGQRDAVNGVKWTGAESAVWDYQTSNWSLDDVATTFVAKDGITFDDNASAKTVSVADLMPISRAEINTSATYTFKGDGGFSGEGMLVKNGTGKLILNTTKSDYTGATVINEGTVEVKELADGGNTSSIGAASNSADNIKIGKATLIVNNTNTSTDRGITLIDDATINVPSGTTSLKGTIKGNGTLNKTGTGQLNITYGEANAWAGTTLTAGTLAMGSWNTTFGKATSPMHVVGNATIVMFDNNSTSAMPSYQNVTTIDEGKTLTFRAGSRCTVKGSLLGKGTYKISFPYVRGDVYTNVSGFEGTYDVTTSNCRFVQAMDFSKSTLKLEADSYAAGYKAGSGTEQSYTHKVGSLQGSGTFGTGVWNVGYLGKNDTFSGVFNSAASLNKYGDGILTLSGASAGNLSIYAGEVEAKNTSAPITTGTITVRTGGILDGTGQVKNVTVMSGGTIGAGKSTSLATGTLTVTGNLNMNAGATLRVRTRSTSVITTSDAFKVAGSVKLTSPKIEVTELSAGNEIVDDAALRLFTGTGSVTISGDITIVPAQPKAGWLWDTSTLTEDGILRIVPDPVGIREVNADNLTSDDVIYDTAGRRVNSITQSGTYIVNGKKLFVRK